MPTYDRNNILNQFFKPVGQDVAGNPNPRMFGNFGVRKGSLISFNYVYWRNDAYPLVVVSQNALANGKLWGVNLHYLTFPYIRKILGMSEGDPNFSYSSISGDAYMKKAFRSYKWRGIRQVKVLEPKFLMDIMSMARSYDPAEVQIIRRQVQEQIGRKMNPKASEMTNLEGQERPDGGR